jgi:integrase
MANIETRKNDDGTTSYRVKIRLKGHPPESATFARLTDAREWGKKTEADIKAGRHFGISKRHDLNALIDRYEGSKDFSKLKSAPDVKTRLRFWREQHGDTLLSNMTPDVVARSRDKLKETPKLKGGGIRSDSDVNRALAALSSACTYAVKELGWLEKNPLERVSKGKEPKGRTRFLSDEELPKFLKACRESKNPDLYLAAILSLTTGGRQSEIMGLRWGQIDLKAGRATLHAGTTKNDDARVLPLVGEALALLKERAKVRNLKDDRIFPPSKEAKKSKFIDLGKSFITAKKEAGITDFHWHDIRHSCASHLMMNGVSSLEISKLLGHRTLQMVSRYAHLAPTRASDISNALAQKLGVA